MVLGKRNRDSQNDDEHDGPKKRNSGPCIKILVPSISCGCLIGKGGEVMQRLKQETSTQIVTSKSNEFFPGTRERVIRIEGDPDNIMNVISFIQDKQEEEYGDKIPSERSKQILLVIPNELAGAIIGKAGSTLKKIRDEAGLRSLNVSNKNDRAQDLERIVTVDGDTPAALEKGARMVIDILVGDPLHNSIRTVHYNREYNRDSDMGGRGDRGRPDMGGRGRPDMGGRGDRGRFDPEPSRSGRESGGNWSFSDGKPAFPDRNVQPFNGRGASSNPSLSLKLGPGEAIRPSLELTTQMVDHVRRALSHSNIGDQAMRDITTSIGTLASYGLVGPDDMGRRNERNFY